MRDAAAAFVRAIIDEGARSPTSGRSTGRLCATTLPAAGGWTVLCSFAGGCAASWLSVPSSPVLRRTKNSFSSIFCLALHRPVFNWRTRPGRLAAPTRWRGPAPEQRRCINVLLAKVSLLAQPWARTNRACRDAACCCTDAAAVAPPTLARPSRTLGSVLRRRAGGGPE